MEKKRIDLLCIGQLAADILIQNIDKVDFSVDTRRVEKISVKSGGDCLNTAVAAARLGTNVRFAGKIGDDALGRYLAEEVKKNGVDPSGLIVAPSSETSACAVAVRPDGERVFLYYGGTNDTFCVKDVRPQDIEECRAVHIGGTYNLPALDGTGAADVFCAAKQAGKITSMDVTYDTSGRWLEIIQPCLAHLDYFMPSINEAKYITGKNTPEAMADFLLQQGTQNVIIKLGAEGVYFCNATEQFRIPAYKVPVRDTTGAGDSFTGGFLAGLMRGFSHWDAVRLGSATAAFCIQKTGASDGIPDFDTVTQFMQEELKKE